MKRFLKSFLLMAILDSPFALVCSLENASKAASLPPPTLSSATQVVPMEKVPRIRRLEQLSVLDEQLYRLCKEIAVELSTNTNNGRSPPLLSMAKVYMDLYELQFNNSAKLSVLQNPIATYLMAERLVLSSDIANSLVEMPQFQSSLETTLRTTKSKLLQPTEIQEFIMPILQLQRLLMLDPSQIASGRLMDVTHPTTTTLDAFHCVEIGQEALKKGWFVESILWLRLSLEVHRSQGQDFEASQVWENLQDAVQQHNQNFRLDHDFFLQPIQYLTNSELDMTVRKAEYAAFARRKYRGAHPKLNMTLTALCRRETYQTEAEKSDLFCWYEHKRSPFLTFNPIKSELVSRNPLIIQFYQVATTRAVETLRALYPKAPKVKNINRHTTDFTDTFSMPKFMIIDRPEVLALLKTMASVTGVKFSPKYCRNLEGRLHVFSPGGHDEIQSDLLGYHPKHNGDRFATALLYLSEEDIHGGDTIFPYAGVAIKPVSGSILFFYNTLPNGWLDDRSMYGICPTTQGHNYFVKFWPSHGIPVAPDQDCQPYQNYFTFPANGLQIPTDDPLPHMENSEIYDDLMFLPHSVEPSKTPKRNPFKF